MVNEQISRINKQKSIIDKSVMNLQIGKNSV